MNTHFWWNQEKNAHLDIFDLVKTIDSVQAGEASNTLKNYRLYGNMDSIGMDWFNYNRTTTQSMNSKVKLNIVQSMCDTVTNKITKNKPRVKFLTSGATPSLQKASKNLEKFTDGIFYKLKLYNKMQIAFKDAAIDGTGWVKFWRDEADIKCERNLPIELVIDDNEALYGNPQNLYQKKWVSKEQLMIWVDGDQEKERLIKSANTQGKSQGYNFTPSNSSRLPEMVLVIEAWHLPSKKDKSDGKHVISIETGVLFENPWEKDYFPFVKVIWNKKPTGFKGSGLANELTGLQIEINKTLRTIQLSNELNGIPRVLIENTSKIVQEHINNGIGSIVEYEGTKPEFINAQPVHPDLYTWFRELYQKAYEISGVSQMSSTATKPSGVTAAAALRELSDIDTERFITVGQMYEDAFLQAARICIDLARDIENDDKISDKDKIKVQVKGRRFLEEIKWSDIDLEENQYQMQMMPASMLSNTVAGRRQDIEDLINLGVIQKEDAADLLNMPDIEAYMTTETASVRDIKYTIEKIVEDGEYSSPEAFQNLQYGIKSFMSAYLNYKWDMPEDTKPQKELKEQRLELLRKWIKEATTKMKQATQDELAMQQQVMGNQQQAEQIKQNQNVSSNSEIKNFANN